MRPSALPNPPFTNPATKQMCHPDRSVAKWRDLLFLSSTSPSPLGASPSPLSSRPKWRDLQCACQPSRIPVTNPATKQMCHPDRSVAKWRDLLFLSSTNQPLLKTSPSPLSSRPKWRDLQCACQPSRISRYKPSDQTDVSSRPERSEVERPAVPLIQKPISLENVTLPFVIPTEVEGSAVRPPALPNPPLQTQRPNRCVIPTGA